MKRVLKKSAIHPSFWIQATGWTSKARNKRAKRIFSFLFTQISRWLRKETGLQETPLQTWTRYRISTGTQCLCLLLVLKVMTKDAATLDNSSCTGGRKKKDFHIVRGIILLNGVVTPQTNVFRHVDSVFFSFYLLLRVGRRCLLSPFYLRYWAQGLASLHSFCFKFILWRIINRHQDIRSRRAVQLRRESHLNVTSCSFKLQLPSFLRPFLIVCLFTVVFW